MTVPYTIRHATPDDKPIVLEFCQDTFSWGDYIAQVWDHWLQHGTLLVYDTGQPVGMCHCSTTKSQMWFEGVRVSPKFRRQGIATKLLSSAEQIGIADNADTSCMLVESNNAASIAMAKSMKYHILDIWNFYSLSSHSTIHAIDNNIDNNIGNDIDNTLDYNTDPTNHKDTDVIFADTIDHTKYQYYVESWRWIKLDDNTIQKLAANDCIIRYTTNDNESVAIITNSDSFGSAIVTLFAGSSDTLTPIISYLQNYAIQHNLKSIHIATTSNIDIPYLSLKSTFYLMRKQL